MFDEKAAEKGLLFSMKHLTIYPPASVSYTHLDVYKRQLLCYIYYKCQILFCQERPGTFSQYQCGAELYFRSGRAGIDHSVRQKAVSYTHLDVYKRQQYHHAVRILQAFQRDTRGKKMCIRDSYTAFHQVLCALF